MAVAVRQADHAAHDVVCRSDRDAQRARGGLNVNQLTVGQIEHRDVLGMHEELIARRAFDETMDMMHPGVVAAHVSASDEEEGVRW